MMQRIWLGALAGAVFATLCVAQENNKTAEYSTMEIRAEQAEGVNGRAETFSGSVEITLRDESNELEPMLIQAERVRFEYADDETLPDTVILEENVSIRHPQGHATAKKVIWNFSEGTLELTGDPVLRHADGAEIHGTSIIYDMGTGKFFVKNMVMPPFQFRAPGEAEAAGPEANNE